MLRNKKDRASDLFVFSQPCRIPKFSSCFGIVLPMSKLFLSHRLELLAEKLGKEIFEDGCGFFATRIVIVPNSSLKQWIMIQIAQGAQEKGVAGCKAMTLQEALKVFASPSGFIEIYCSLYQELANSQRSEIRSYLNRSERRIVEFASHLAELCIRYGNFCPSLFEPDPTSEDWQRQLIQTLFVSGKLSLPVQMSPVSFATFHCFGFDYLPSVIWKLFNFRAIYLFSPCAHFWEDLCTDRERKRLDRFWKEQGASDRGREELDAYLKNAPSLLANWGRAGRETLKILDTIVEDTEEDYTLQKCSDSTLTRLQERLLSFEVNITHRYSEDSSIQLSKTGSSLLREIEHLRTSILRLANEEGVLFSEIAVFAPDIQPYVPLIQFAFSDIPYRISGLEIGSKSFFYQGMHRFFELDLDFDSEDLMALFENPSFSKARGWDPDLLEEIREWLSQGKKSETDFLDQFIYLFPEEKKRISSSSSKALEQFILIHQSLRSDLAFLKKARSLADWSRLLLELVQKYFSVDLLDEADASAWGFFKQSMSELEKADPEGKLFPFDPIQALLKRPIPGGQLRSTHLHAIRFGTIAEGVLTPVRALFLIGMDEESFPRRSFSSSLDLLKFEKIYPFESFDRDRYLFLQALFSAREFLHFSYGHLSSDGNPVNPCSLIEELIRNIDAPLQENKVSLPLIDVSKTPFFDWPERPVQIQNKEERSISLSDLSSLARHPWEFYLKKRFGIRFEIPENSSFSAQKSKILRAHLQSPLRNFLSEFPSGICGEAMKIDVEEIFKEWSDSMQSWDIAIEPASFRMSCHQKMKNESGWVFPSLEVALSTFQQVKLVGDVKTFSSKGFIHAGNDNLEGLLRVWPECLAALIASGKQEIYCLKSGKIKTVDRPDRALKAFVSYYFLSQSAPSPLLADWADTLLRKGVGEWEKKIKDKLMGKGVRFEDPVWNWVIGRVNLPQPSLWYEMWDSILQEVFSELTALYPLRGKHAAV